MIFVVLFKKIVRRNKNAIIIEINSIFIKLQDYENIQCRKIPRSITPLVANVNSMFIIRKSVLSQKAQLWSTDANEKFYVFLK